MYKHFKNIEYLYGDKAYIQMPNGIFRDLSNSIKSRNSTNIQQSSFAYSYLVTLAFLYKYAHFVDVDNETYIQNSDIKQVLGYDKTTKTIDKIIKKNGILEKMELVSTTNDYPVIVNYLDDEVNGVKIRNFITINSMTDEDVNYNLIKSIVKNRNYEIREPTFLFDYNGDIGTLYNYENTHRITIKEFLEIIYNEKFDNIDFMMYSYFKSKCHGLIRNTKAIALYKISLELGIGKDCFYIHLKSLKKAKYIEVNHKCWKSPNCNEEKMDANEYIFRGV